MVTQKKNNEEQMYVHQQDIIWKEESSYKLYLKEEETEQNVLD